jgi:ATPase subunit of ABC transporter with duplicated ATPase domains
MRMAYETIMVDGGASLSGGQRQRVALARALAHSPSILLLDEATSELDALTERAVYRNIADLGCTAIVIAHRLSTISGADLIIVMEGGRIVERGTHEELLELRGRYHELTASQRDAVRAGETDPRQRAAKLPALRGLYHEPIASQREAVRASEPDLRQRAAKLDKLIRDLSYEVRASARSSASSTTDSSTTSAVDRPPARRTSSDHKDDHHRAVTSGSGGNRKYVRSNTGADVPKKGAVHVVRSDNGWRVEVEGQSRASDTYGTQQAAWQEARQIAQRNQSEALLHGRNGQIRKRSGYGKDARRRTSP